MSLPALFLDRDGVINVDTGYVHRIEDFRFVPGIFELCRFATARGLPIVVVTNQAGIGRGYYSEADFQRLTHWMKARFLAEGAPLLDVRHCPFHPTEGVGEYRRDADCRKPRPGMLLDAARVHGLCLERSAMIGDTENDMLAARAAGLPYRLYLTPVAGHGAPEAATHVLDNLASGVDLLGSLPAPWRRS